MPNSVPTVPVPDTFKVGMIIVISGVFLMLSILAYVEIQFSRQDSPSIGYRLEAWSRDNPWFAAALLVVLGALLAHFVLNPWPPMPVKPGAS